MTKPRILLFDIETFPNVSYTWQGKYEVDVIAFKEEWTMASFAYKYLDEKKIVCVSRRQFDDKTDKSVVSALYDVMSSADILVAHNGDQFDVKKTHARFIFHGLSPLKPPTTIDTKKIAKRYFSFNSNSLNDLGVHLGLGKKVKHSGFELWEGCMKGCQKSWDLMEKYNKGDVALLEKVYKVFLPWIQNHPGLTKDGCSNCSGNNCVKRGFKLSKAGRRQIWQCLDCGAWHSGQLIKIQKPQP